jgi:ATP-dependent DNA helicase RecG
MMARMVADLAQTLGTIESATLEFNCEATGRDAIRQAICALANDLIGAGGGDLLIGVARNGEPYPIDVSDEALLTLERVLGRVP